MIKKVSSAIAPTSLNEHYHGNAEISADVRQDKLAVSAKHSIFPFEARKTIH